MKTFFRCLLIVTLAGTYGLLAQQEESQKRRTDVFDVDLQQTQQTNEQILPQQQFFEQAFEKSIDPESYILGPGDQLLIRVSGIFEKIFSVTVSPEGYLLPNVTDVYVSGKTLSESVALITQALSRTYLNATFSVKLMKLRKFRVFIVGEVRYPGTYYLRAVDRVGDVIQLAGGLMDWGDDARIEIRHIDGTIDTVNINEFYLTGDLAYNPQLRGGDIIYIPSIDLQQNYVIIEGNVGSQGIYQIRENETIFDFLTRLRAINRRSDIENVILIRSNSRKRFNLLNSDTPARQEVLQTGDRIIIPSRQNNVYVRGEVVQPGALPYLANYTTKDYAGKAGILETAKSLDNLYVIRSETGQIEKGKDVIVGNGDIVVVPRRSRETFKDILTILTPIISIGISSYALIKSTN